MEKEGRRCENSRKQREKLLLLTFHRSGSPSFIQAAWIESINMYLSTDHNEVDGCKTYPKEFTYICIIYIFCGSQVNLNPALWDLHKLRAWGVAAVSLVLCILV